jgi:hypothetical protein
MLQIYRCREGKTDTRAVGEPVGTSELANGRCQQNENQKHWKKEDG